MAPDAEGQHEKFMSRIKENRGGNKVKRPVPAITTVPVVNKLFDGGNHETDENL